jgi:probable phosphoglycerate mutase
LNLLYFVRHGEGVDNVARRFSCKNLDHPLTERGRRQAGQTARYLAADSFDGIYCSPMKRAFETAQIIASLLKEDPIVMEDFREVNVGDLEGMPFNNQNWRAYHHLVNEWFSGNTRASLPGGEDYESLWARMQRGLRHMLNGRKGQVLLLVGHAGIFSATLKNLCPGTDLNWLKSAEYYNCAITKLEIESRNGDLQGRLIDWANYGHLDEQALSRVPGIPPVNDPA